MTIIEGSDLMKKILFAIPTLGGGGAERVLVTLLNNLSVEKYDITLFCIFDGGPNKKYLNSNIKYRYFFKKVFRGNIHLLKLFSSGLLYKIMIKDKYDIAISYLEGPTTRIISGCPFTSTKLLNWIHIEIHDQKMLLRSFRDTNELIDIHNRYDATIFVSDTARKAFNKTFQSINNKKLVLHNTVDNLLITAKSNEEIGDLVINNNKINLVSVGRFTEQKGYERLLRVIYKLAKEIPIHLYLIGKGELETKYKEIINELNLHDYVSILGFKENPYKYVKRCDLFVCSSYREGYSTAVTESLIVGTPVVTTLCSGMEEMLGSNNEYGVITENEEEALYEGIRIMLTEPGLLEHYKQKAIDRGYFFSKNKTVEAVEELLDNI